MEDRITTRIRKAITDHVFPGCVVGVIEKDSHTILPFGTFTYEKDSNKVTEDTIFDVASVTKAIPTASLALQLIDEGMLTFDTKVQTVLPEFTAHGASTVTVRHLLTQTVAYRFTLSSLKTKSADELLQIILTTPLKKQPGAAYQYTNTSSILLGMVIEKILNMPLDQAAEVRFFKPLSMGRTTFHPQLFTKEEIMPTELDEVWRTRIVHGEVHDESASVLYPKIVGSAGLFSTVPDLLHFLYMLLSGGSYGGRQFFSKTMLQLVFQNHLKDSKERHGLGWEVHNKRFMGKCASDRMFGKTGFTGCVLIGDIYAQKGMILLSNHIYPKRYSVPNVIHNVRRDIADIVFCS